MHAMREKFMKPKTALHSQSDTTIHSDIEYPERPRIAYQTKSGTKYKIRGKKENIENKKNQQQKFMR